MQLHDIQVAEILDGELVMIHEHGRGCPRVRALAVRQRARSLIRGLERDAVAWNMGAVDTSTEDNTLGAAEIIHVVLETLWVDLPKVTSQWWPHGPTAMSKLLNRWYMQN